MTAVPFKLLNVILPFTDTVAPIITSGPLFRSITSTSAVVEWQTDEPTTGSVKVGSITATATDLATTHSIQVNGLTASTTYAVEVSAVDKSSNGPTLKTGSFTSASSADTKPPIILEGPTVFNSTNNSLVVQWITNEPSKGSLTYGTSSNATGSTITESTLSVVHRAELTGLTSNTQYYVRASATDAAGNGPTLSRIGTGRTLGSADSVAPVITNGPLIYDIQSDKASVKWKTDKPTNSGVSWNDGTVHGVLTDPLYVTDHSQQATGLLANTKYYLTVSSTDALGNGPTLSKTVEFTTLPAAQTSAPQVLAQPQIVSVTNTTAVVTWPTDQPSTSEVSYGTSANTLSQAENRATLTTDHSVPLVGLTPNTTYFVQVNSKNVGAKNSVNAYPNSPTTSLGFKTTSIADTQLPSFSTPPAVGYATDKQAVVQWKTDKMADSVVTITSVGFDEPPRIKSDGALNDQHEISLTGLTPNNKYSVSVTSTDLSGNTTTTVLADFSTPPSPDSSVPQIVQGPGVQTTASTATITWVTDKISDSKVSYGTTSLNQMAGDISYTKQHQVTLGNLSAASNYQVKVVSTDPSGNSSTAATASFTTSNADGTAGTSVTTNSATTTTVGSSTTTTQTSSTGSINNTSLSSVTLVKGWNLIGNGADQTINVASVFNDSTKFTTVWKWVASNTKWAFYAPSLNTTSLTSYAAGKGYDVLTSINAGEGFWVNAAQATTLNLQSGSATPTGIYASSFQTGGSKALPTGWSLIAIGDNKTPSDFNLALSATPPTTTAAPINLTTLWAWDAAVSNWMFFAPSLVNSGTLSTYISSKGYLGFGSKTLTPAMGFWVNKP